MQPSPQQPSPSLPPKSFPHATKAHHQPLLGYERLAVAGLIREDALCILGAGMGWQRLVSVFARLHHYQQVGLLCVTETLVFLHGRSHLLWFR